MAAGHNSRGLKRAWEVDDDGHNPKDISDKKRLGKSRIEQASGELWRYPTSYTEPPQISTSASEIFPPVDYQPKTIQQIQGTQDNPYEIDSSPPPRTFTGASDSISLLNYNDETDAKPLLPLILDGTCPEDSGDRLSPPLRTVKDVSNQYNDVESLSEPALCKEQADLVNLIMSGQNVFYTGSAGCGKSTVLKAFVSRFQAMGKRVHILAPTGRAALAINGTTTWTYAGWTPGHHKYPIDDLLGLAHQKFVWKRLNETQVLVIDEISMIENLHFERLNLFLKEARNNAKAFGGVQVIVTGDFCQLPPVKPFQHCIDCGKELTANRQRMEYYCHMHRRTYYDKDKWAFQSKAWEECNFNHVNLKTIHRQSDTVFIDILQKLRLGNPLASKDIKLLLDHPVQIYNSIKLFGTRAEVDRLNNERFSKLKTRPRNYKCLDNFQWNQQHGNLRSKGDRAPNGGLKELEDKEHRYNSFLRLKQGMPVVLLANLDISIGLVNGAQGVIQRFVPYDPSTMPRVLEHGGKHSGPALIGAYAQYRESQIHEFIKNAECAEEKEWPDVQFSNGVRRVIYADCSINEYGDEKPYTILSRTQIPLIPGYAITTHKSQGMTLNKVEVDLSRTFEAGQAYVALSRARSLEGLKVVSFPRSAQCGADTEVKEFLREKFGIQ